MRVKAQEKYDLLQAIAYIIKKESRFFITFHT